MKRLVLVMAMLIAGLCASSGALAQDRLLGPGDIQASGEHEIVLGFDTYVTCITAKPSPRPGVTPYLGLTRCDRGIPLKLRFLGRNRVTIEVGGSGGCATVARNVIIGPRSIDILPCTNALDQQFIVEFIGGDLVSLRTAEGCWTGRNTSYPHGDFVDLGCSDDRKDQRFRLIDAGPAPAPVGTPALPPGYVAPAGGATPGGAYPGTVNGSRLGTATPVAPPTLPRPGELPATAPRPGTYMVSTRDFHRCIGTGVIGSGETASTRLNAGNCLAENEVEIKLTFVPSRGFIISNGYGETCVTLSRAPNRPWVGFAACTAAEDQVFDVEMTGYGDYYLIRSKTGLCLTVRGNQSLDAETINTAIFAEPCRSAPEQNFTLEDYRRAVERRGY